MWADAEVLESVRGGRVWLSPRLFRDTVSEKFNKAENNPDAKFAFKLNIRNVSCP